MRALVCTSLDGPDALELQDVPAPDPGDAGVLIDVDAAGVCFPDLLLTQGKYQMRLEPPFTLGTECAGTVAAAPEASGFRSGDRVMAMTLQGAFADQVVAQPHMTFRIPDGLSTDQAAGFVMNYHTAHFCWHRRARLQAGETVLVNGASGGVGTAAIQVAKAAGAAVIGIASTEEKRQVVLDAGADHAIGWEGFKDRVKELTDGRGVDVLLDVVGGDAFLDGTRSLAPEGRLLVVGFAGGSIPEIRVNRLLLNNISLVGAGWGALLMHEPSLLHTTAADLDRLVSEGALDPLVGPTYALEDAAEAVRSLGERSAYGKVVVHVRD